MNIEEKYFINVDKLAIHLYAVADRMSPIRLQKTLYFLYAFYGATYGQIAKDSESDYPAELFEADFEAWQYGPVISEVYRKNRNDLYSQVNDDYEKDKLQGTEKDIIVFIDDLVKQLSEMSDFALVDRTHNDKVWIDAYGKDKINSVINKEELVNEYVARLQQASAI